MNEQKLPPTMYIKNCRVSSNIKACSPNENCSKLKNECFEIGNFSYTQRWSVFDQD